MAPTPWQRKRALAKATGHSPKDIELMPDNEISLSLGRGSQNCIAAIEEAMRLGWLLDEDDF